MTMTMTKSFTLCSMFLQALLLLSSTSEYATATKFSGMAAPPENGGSTNEKYAQEAQCENGEAPHSAWLTCPDWDECFSMDYDVFGFSNQIYRLSKRIRTCDLYMSPANCVPYNRADSFKIGSVTLDRDEHYVALRIERDGFRLVNAQMYFGKEVAPFNARGEYAIDQAYYPYQISFAEEQENDVIVTDYTFNNVMMDQNGYLIVHATICRDTRAKASSESLTQQ